MSSIYERVHERSAEFWNFAFVSSIVLEYKDNRNLRPRPRLDPATAATTKWVFMGGAGLLM